MIYKSALEFYFQVKKIILFADLKLNNHIIQFRKDDGCSICRNHRFFQHSVIKAL